jgi:N-acetylglucosaminyldiphosphoundecaprenol N-acetyl-beta-D-mannosaminyltransferase
VIDAGKRRLLGVDLDALDLDALRARILRAAHAGEPLAVSALAVHGLTTAALDPALRFRLNRLDVVAPDGQPVRLALNALYGTGLREAARGTDLAFAILGDAEEAGLPVYFYGSTPETLAALDERVRADHPALQIAGLQPSRFGPADAAAQDGIAAGIRDSGGRIVLVGLGAPRQERFVSAMRDRVGVPILAVGAAFDYLAGTLTLPPRIVSEKGFEWLWRLVAEPGRLWRRYLLLNPLFVALVCAEALGMPLVRGERAPATADVDA